MGCALPIHDSPDVPALRVAAADLIPSTRSSTVSVVPVHGVEVYELGARRVGRSRSAGVRQIVWPYGLAIGLLILLLILHLTGAVPHH